MGKGSKAPRPDPRIGEAAVRQAALGEEYLDFAKDAFAVSEKRQADLDALTKRVTEAQLAEMERQGAISRADRARYETLFRPLEDAFVEEAATYDSPERQAEAAARARADVTSAAARERSAGERRAFSLGINPASGRFAGLDREFDLATGLASVGAENEARRDVRNTGLALRGAAIDLGRGLPTSAQSAARLGIDAGSVAAGNAGNANSQYIASTGIVAPGYRSAQSGYANQASVLTGLYDRELDAYNAAESRRAQNAAGWGQALGTAAGLFLAGDKPWIFSSRDAKREIEAVPDGKALDAVEQLPVATYRYKPGVADDAQHVGPMADDFAQATGKGDGTAIPVQDAIGLALGAVKDLSAKVERVERAVGITRRAA